MENDFNDLSGMFQDEQGRPRTMTDEQVKHMVNRFLAWKLPMHFNPDNGISFDPIMNKGHDFEARREPVGTNLLSADQATVMVRHMIEGLPSLGEEISAGRIRELWKECGGMVDKKNGRFWIEPQHCAELVRKIIGEITRVAYKSEHFTG